MKVAALYIDCESIYKKKLRAVYCWDKTRCAENYNGSMPVVAHPPCAQWCRLAHFAAIKPKEKALARKAVKQVRRCGGVLEHPAYSKLWKAENLPLPGGLDVDRHGGWTLELNQYDFNHIVQKKTWLYIVGAKYGDVVLLLPKRRRLPKNPPLLWCNKVAQKAGRVILNSSKYRGLRINTPPLFADFLLSIAVLCQKNG